MSGYEGLEFYFNLMQVGFLPPPPYNPKLIQVIKLTNVEGDSRKPSNPWIAFVEGTVVIGHGPTLQEAIDDALTVWRYLLATRQKTTQKISSHKNRRLKRKGRKNK
ncbi:MAG: hypothetical protein M3Q44_07560 [bacterium]|nr:hypothetical protein [bacterium]